MANYFNTLNLRQQLAQLGKCRFMARDEFADEAGYLKGKKVVIVGCGAQGLNQGLNMRDSGLDVAYALRKEAIDEKRASWRKATENGFKVGTYEDLIPQADLVVNLTPDKQHSSVVRAVQPLMKDGAALGYSHGFNISNARVTSLFSSRMAALRKRPLPKRRSTSCSRLKYPQRR